MKKSETLDKRDVGKRFRQFRQSIDLTQLELAKILGLTQTTITGIEKGKSFPSLTALSYLAEHYALSISWLITGQGDMTGENSHSLDQLIAQSEYNDEIIDLVRHVVEVPVVRDFILEQFVVFKLRNKSKIKKFQDNKSG